MERPRVGDDVFADGRWCRVMAVRGAHDVVRHLSEEDAEVFVARWRAVLGTRWEQIFVEVDVVRTEPSGKVVHATVQGPHGFSDVRRWSRG